MLNSQFRSHLAGVESIIETSKDSFTPGMSKSKLSGYVHMDDVAKTAKGGRKVPLALRTGRPWSGTHRWV